MNSRSFTRIVFAGFVAIGLTIVISAAASAQSAEGGTARDPGLQTLASRFFTWRATDLVCNEQERLTSNIPQQSPGTPRPTRTKLEEAEVRYDPGVNGTFAGSTFQLAVSESPFFRVASNGTAANASAVKLSATVSWPCITKNRANG